MMSALIWLVISLLVLFVVGWLIIYVIRSVPVPDPPARIITVVVVVIFTLIAILMLLQFAGVNVMNMPRMG
jgi:hypothetical protein